MTIASTAVLVLAAGAGTRMRSSTPKVLHELGGRTLLAHSLAAGAQIDPEHLVAVVGHQRERVAQACAGEAERLRRDVSVAVQEVQDGTGGAVKAGLTVLPDDFAGVVVVTAADIPLLTGEALSALVDRHRDTGAAVTLMTFTADDPTGYGRVLRTQDGAVTEIVEQKDATDEQRRITEVNSGVYAFDAAVLAAALGQLSTDNAQHEMYLTDVVAIARTMGKSVVANHIDDAALVAGCNDKVQLADLGAEMNRRTLRRHLLAGVTIVDPATTWIDVDVALDADVVIKPNTQLHGATAIATGAIIGPDTTLTDVTVGTGAQIVRTHGSDATIADDAQVGPFAYLRPGTRLGVDAKIGTFVETKNADIGAGSKIPHLTYVGDATIGEHSNIGASSVFVNYDGVHKNHTVIGSHCRTGSDNMFVAPVRVGDGAYTGAGTVIRHDVPPGALAVSGGQQRNIEGWVESKRPDTPSAEAARSADPRATGSTGEQNGTNTQ
ncbi:bifunctional UDP-N-acetylglucosamine diphosphorylase/glucosamine-1-phosphate N-acetyltransferase GlmU [Williamsia sterculiae]|uniref:Bifunctional protein GlmU n=1 Tax=Williamsia sterculiae TaxID=1344003 RepID=A0A1N7DP14_9NOCA|nr:bifunctional UDP-N-acetylglucosamine diphosphorylase/glucosamine-1-phosphate N-acetyltransferase GlmU [Williamsia sterculiae]SIR77567.1 UDP-N-acetylglucosamine pyrophosphorylase /glucosamine-1-phosphate N-acetyltransferase [Williamsia sterculiae]